MLPPYQCLQMCGSVLLAATSSRVDSFSIDDGSRLSSWTCPTSLEENPRSTTQPTGENGEKEAPEPKGYNKLTAH
jgi:hypothetical protein